MKQSSLDAMKWKKCYCLIYSVVLYYLLARLYSINQIPSYTGTNNGTNSSICCILGCNNLLYKNKKHITNQIKKLDLEWSTSVVFSLQKISDNSSHQQYLITIVNLKRLLDCNWYAWELLIVVVRSLPSECFPKIKRGHVKNRDLVSYQLFQQTWVGFYS